MADIADYPTIVLEFNKKGKATTNDHRQKLSAFVETRNLTDLVVLSHGWNNSQAEAMDHYKELGAAMKRQSSHFPDFANRRFGLALVIWPSKAIKGFETVDAQATGGGGAAATLPLGTDPMEDVTPEDPTALIEAALAELELDDSSADKLRTVAQAALADENAFKDFLERFDAAFADTDAPDEGEPPEDGVEEPIPVPEETTGDDVLVIDEPGSTTLFDMLDDVGNAAGEDDDWEGGAAGGTVKKAGNAVVSALNILTFYKMKRRAGYVGSRGVAMSLAGLRINAPALRIHMSGHSFGARVLTMATFALQGSGQARPNTLCLIQAAFSHNSFSPNVPGPSGGFFRDVVGKHYVDGTIIVTHTHNDKAVYIAYSIASAAVGQAAAFTGGAPSLYGGLGANGTQHTPEASNINMHVPGQVYDFSTHSVWNLKSDQFISGHADVRNDGVAYAILSAVAES